MICRGESAEFGTNREINSSIEIKKLLENLDNDEINSHDIVLA